MTTDTSQRPEISKPALPRNVRVLSFASLLNDVASEMIFPLLPGFLLTLAAGNKFYLGIIEGLADSVASLLKLWFGAWSDRARRRKSFVVFGYSLAALLRPWIGVISTTWQLAVIRVGDRIGKGIRTSPRDALIAESCRPEQRGRAFGFHRAMDHLGAAIGPLLATAFLWFWPDQIRTLFLLALIPGLAVVALVVFGLTESAKPVNVTGGESESLDADRSAHPSISFRTLSGFDTDFRRFLLALLIFSLGNSSDAFLLLRAEELGVPRVMLPVLWCAFHMMKSWSNVRCGAGVDRFGPKPFILTGWIVYSIIYVGFAVATNAWQVCVLFLGYSFFYGLTEPAEKTLVAMLAGPKRKGLAFGWFNFAIGISTLPASLMFGALAQQFGPLAAFGTGAVLALVAAILVASVTVPARTA